jgi:4-hydroxybenzoate polyprenyltransferase
MSTSVHAAIRLLRVEQWVKNAFVFAGVLFSGRFADPASLMRATLAFVAFCATSSGGYIDNDVVDREADAHHPRKRFRPVAAGTIGVTAARGLQGALNLAGLLLAYAADARVALCVVLYAALTAAYSRWWKHVVVLDVMVIATGFVLRVVAGCAAIDIAPSHWIVLCTFMLALYLGFGKRHHEMQSLAGNLAGQRPVLASYSLGLLDQLSGATSALALVCYLMFTIWPDTVARHGTANLVYTVPIVTYGIFRYQVLVRRGAGPDDPSSALLTDRHLLATAVLWVAAVALALGAVPRGEPWLSR